MTVLEALARRYDRQATFGDAMPAGFAMAQISFTVVLDRNGCCVTTQDERIGDGKRLRPLALPAPAAPRRTVAVASGAFWDKTSYVFGRTAPDQTASEGKRIKGRRASRRRVD
jgi:hypothetical protein